MIPPGMQCYNYYNIAVPETMLSTLEDLENYLEDQGPFDAVLGFSQGAILAATFMVKEARENRITTAFRCAIFFSCPAVVDPLRCKVLDAETDGEILCVSTAHIFGSKDPAPDACFNVSQVCDRRKSEVYEHDCGHEIPRESHAVSEIALRLERVIGKETHG